MIEETTAPAQTEAPHVTADDLTNALLAAADPASNLVTDELAGYTKPGELFASHQTVTHSQGEYVSKDDPDVTSNSIESAFALLKRGVYGTFHSVSKKHLHRYLAEFSFRWNHRSKSDASRAFAIVKSAVGKRLTYKPLPPLDGWAAADAAPSPA